MWIYARVQRPIEDVTLEFPEIGKKLRLPVVKPSEMLRIKLRGEEIRKAKEKITMQVVKNE